MVSTSPQWRALIDTSRVATHSLPTANHTFSRKEWRDDVATKTSNWVKALSNTEAQIYFGVGGGGSGLLWFDDAKVEEVGLVNLVRRAGTPLAARQVDGTVLSEGKDFEHIVDPRMGVKPWNGSYDIYHEAPVIKTSLPDGTWFRVSYYHAVTVNEDQAMICRDAARPASALSKASDQGAAAQGFEPTFGSKLSAFLSLAM